MYSQLNYRIAMQHAAELRRSAEDARLASRAAEDNPGPHSSTRRARLSSRVLRPSTRTTASGS
jgi:hypothetical protein